MIIESLFNVVGGACVETAAFAEENVYKVGHQEIIYRKGVDFCKIRII